VCRLLGYVAEEPVSMVDVLGEDGFERFTALTAVHADGWGMAWQGEDHTIRSIARPDSASDDPAYEELARQRLGRAGLVHLRWAPSGFGVGRSYCHHTTLALPGVPATIHGHSTVVPGCEMAYFGVQCTPSFDIVIQTVFLPLPCVPPG